MGKGSPDAEERLAQLKDSQRDDYKSARRTLLLLGVPLFAGLIALVWFLPGLLAEGDRTTARLQRGLSYCANRERPKVCEQKVTARHEVCVNRELADQRRGGDVYGDCMNAEFENFYLEIGRSLSGR